MRILDALQRWLSNYFHIEGTPCVENMADDDGCYEGDGARVYEMNGEVYVETNFVPDSLKERYTQSIMDGDMSVLTDLINTKNIQGLLFLFRDNLELSQWLVRNAPTDLLLRIPFEVQEVIEQQIG